MSRPDLRTLLARAKEQDLEQYLTCEPRSMRVWRFTLPEEQYDYPERPIRTAIRRFPRRSLQDCMEALLGASFITGGIDMALQTGEALGLSMGGRVPWMLRYPLRPQTPVSPLFTELQDALGYRFRCGTLLLEAVTHPSFKSTDCTSYQRLEWVGDGELSNRLLFSNIEI